MDDHERWPHRFPGVRRLIQAWKSGSLRSQRTPAQSDKSQAIFEKVNRCDISQKWEIGYGK